MDQKIVHILLGKANPERMNGVNKVVNSLATSQAALGANVAIWGITKEIVNNYPERNYETVLFQDHQFKFKIDEKLHEAIRQEPKTTVFHIHGGFIPQFYSVAKALVKNGHPYIYTTHGAYNAVALQRSALKKKIYIALFEKFIVSHASKLHFIGESEITGARTIFGDIPNCLIPNGQEIIQINPGYESKDDHTDDVVIGFCGRIDIYTKGLDLLLEGMALMDPVMRSRVKLWIIGDGEELPQLRAIADRCNVSDNIRFYGSKFGEEKFRLMAKMDYLILNSRNEGLPGVVLEAASQNTPVIVSKETNMGDYVEKAKAGIVIDQNTPEGIRGAIEKAIEKYDSPAYTALKGNATEMIKNVFDWKVIARKMIAVYEVSMKRIAA